MDLHDIQPNVWYMHFIDDISFPHNAAMKKSKTVVVKKFLKY